MPYGHGIVLNSIMRRVELYKSWACFNNSSNSMVLTSASSIINLHRLPVCLNRLGIGFVPVSARSKVYQQGFIKACRFIMY